MSNPRDEIDAWLDRDVEPLVPPPGTFERISRRARRHKRNQVMLSAAAAVVVIAAVAVVPQVASRLLQHGAGPPSPAAAAGQSPTIRTSTRPAKPVPSPTPQPTVPVPSGPSQWATSTGVPVPSRFQPTSITLIGPNVGAVIGQARCAAGQAGLCTSLAATTADGGSWYGGLTAPAAPAPAGASGVSQLRFLNTQYGWAYGPELFATTNNAASWIRQQPPDGMRVTDLETAGSRAFALFASCTGTSSSYAADCTSFSLYSSPEGSTSWQPVRVPDGYAAMAGRPAGQPASASLVLASGTTTDPEAGAGYLLTPTGVLLTGPLTAGAWTVAGHIPAGCQVGTAQPGGQPADAQLATGSMASGPQLLLSCNVAASTGAGAQIEIFSSLTDGRTWKQAGVMRGAGTAKSLAAAAGDLAVLATSAGIEYSADGGAAWQQSAFASTSSAPAGGFSYVGMTSALQGVAVPADAGLGEVFITANGGQTWTSSSLSGS